MANRNATSDLTVERLRALLEYDPLTGAFAWRVSRGGWGAGRAAGRLNADGYVRIGIDGRQYPAHRLAWLYVHGRWPERQIDHRSGERDDNRIANLREASQSQNLGNARLSIRNTSGFKGVSYAKRERKWLATIKVNGRAKCLGLHATPEAAHGAYMAAAREAFGEFARAA